LRLRARAAKAAASTQPEPAMIGIYAIGIFLLVFAALNFYEFGRLD